MFKYHITFLFILVQAFCFAQVGINIEPPDPSSELDIKSTNKGILIPRLSDADMATLGTGAGVTEKSLLIYNTTQHKFFFWDGASWQQLGGICNEITDEDGDTKIQTEKTADEDKIRIYSVGSEKTTIEDTKVTIPNGDLTINNGTFTVNSQYSLPATDGSDGFVLGINSAGVVAWRNPAVALGLVVGISTSSFSNLNQSFDFRNTIYYSRVMSWANIKVTKMAFLFKQASSNSVIPVMGIYDKDGKLVASGTGATIPTSASSQVVEVTLSSSCTLQSGQIYYFALLNNGPGQMWVYNRTYATGSDYSARSEAGTSLPATASFSTTDKGIWMAAY